VQWSRNSTLVGFGQSDIAISSEEKSGAPQQMSTSPPKRIVILGGGFAGLYAAMELEKFLSHNIRKNNRITSFEPV